MDRRKFLAASAAGATAAVVKTAVADELPLGPLTGMRYPEARIESVDKKAFGTTFPAFAGHRGRGAGCHGVPLGRGTGVLP